jgi:methyl-accepting chemotaxis protein
MVSTMGDITNSAKRIGDIISVIDGIASRPTSSR